MAGAVLVVAGLALIAAGPSKDQTPGRIVRDVAFLALAALPVAIGVGILKYHLYDIDRLISRTLSGFVNPGWPHCSSLTWLHLTGVRADGSLLIWPHRLVRTGAGGLAGGEAGTGGSRRVSPR